MLAQERCRGSRLSLSQEEAHAAATARNSVLLALISSDWSTSARATPAKVKMLPRADCQRDPGSREKEQPDSVVPGSRWTDPTFKSLEIKQAFRVDLVHAVNR
jgi:hypothetical protein